MNRRTGRFRAAACLLAGTASLTASGLLLGTSAHAEGEPGSGFLSLGLIAESAGYRIVFTQAATKQPDGAAEGDIPFARTVHRTTSSEALSSMSWPGTLAAEAGKLYTLSTDQEPPVPMNYPVRAQARSETDQSDSNDSVPGATMSAVAQREETKAVAKVYRTTNPEVGTFGPTHVESASAFTGPVSAVVTSDSSVEDVSLAAGVITIGSVTSHAKGTTDNGVSDATGRTTVQNMKIADVPVTVDEDGVHVQGQGLQAKAANKAVNQALAQTQTQVYLTDPHKTKTAAGVVYDSGNLLMTFGNGQFYVLLGGARVIVGGSATTPFNAPPPPPPPQGSDSTPAAVPPGSTTNPPVGTGTSTGTGPTQPGAAPATAAPGPVTAAPSGTFSATPVSLPGGLSPGWPAFALLGAGLIMLGLRWLPTRLLEEQPTPCPLGEQ